MRHVPNDGRDAASPVLRQIEAIYIAIKAHLFSPDETRAKRWSEVQTLEDAVKLVASSSHLQSFSGGRLFAFSSMSADVAEDDSHVDHAFQDVPDSGDVLPGDVLPGFGDDTTLLELRDHALRDMHGVGQADFETCASDISVSSDSSDSVVETDSDSDDADRQVELNGHKNARGLIAPSDLASKECFQHVKSRKLHLVARSLFSSKFFKCGRKCNDNYQRLSEVPAFAAHGCMTCFGWSQKPTSDSSE
eukprot:s684_g15.t1